MTSLSPQPLSPLDGRYQAAVSGLGGLLSEAGLNKHRIHVEIEWLIELTELSLFGTSPLSPVHKQQLRQVVANFSDEDVAKLAEFEAVTRHDVKAVEYFIREKLEELELSHLAELTHFAATSEDINNLAYALGIQQAVREHWLPAAEELLSRLTGLAREHATLPMLSRTHGQPATPTTLGKELAVFSFRLRRQLKQLETIEYLGKFSGATGTFAAHAVADPGADWAAISKDFVERLGLVWNPLTTQIESHDWQVELYYRISHANGILHNLATDVWSYISLGYFRQIPVPGATGSSTMPHKINPIKFENAESNLETSNALLLSLASTLVTSRLQRDLTDSSTQRNIGVALGHSLLALRNILDGLGQLDVAPEVLAADLDNNWEVLAEAIQTVIRAEVAAGRSKIVNPYELLKELTRGKRLGQEELQSFVSGLDLPQESRERLAALRPETYLGLAAELIGHLGE